MKFATSYICLAAALLPALGAPLHAQTPAQDYTNPAPPVRNHPSRVPNIGINLGAFFPADVKTRNRFGSVWTSVGLGIGSAAAPSNAGRFGLDIGLTAETSGSNYAYVVPVGIAYRRAFISPGVTAGQPFIPYFGVTVDAVGVDLRSKQDNINSGVQLTGGGSLTLGTTVGKTAFVEARYSEIAKVKGFDLSGLGLTAGVRF